MIRLKPKTPKKISSSIKRFLKDAGMKGKLSYLPFTELNKDYKANYCLNNCESHNLHYNTPIVYGWIIWEDRKNKFIEAEFHAVICEKGKSIDITPRKDNEKHILFMEEKRYIPKRLDNKTWKTYTNFKSINGKITEQSRHIEIVDTNA